VQRLVGREDLDAEEMEEFIYKWRGMMTMPFEKDSVGYLKELDEKLLVNNTNFLWLEFEGVVDDAKAKQRTVIASSVTVVGALLLVAGGVFYAYTTRRRSDDALISPTGNDSPIVGAVIGVNNAREDILVSESYDDDYVRFGAGHQNDSLLMRNNSRTDDELEPSFDMIKGIGPHVSSPATAISDIESSADVADKAKQHASPSQGTVFSGGTDNSPRNSQEVATPPADESKEEEPAVDDASQAGSSAAYAPSFVGDFQMEIQDLED